MLYPSLPWSVLVPLALATLTKLQFMQLETSCCFCFPSHCVPPEAEEALGTKKV